MEGAYPNKPWYQIVLGKEAEVCRNLKAKQNSWVCYNLKENLTHSNIKGRDELQHMRGSGRMATLFG
jgi:hypothetical protein